MGSRWEDITLNIKLIIGSILALLPVLLVFGFVAHDAYVNGMLLVLLGITACVLGAAGTVTLGIYLVSTSGV